jgi:hypothetical protein
VLLQSEPRRAQRARSIFAQQPIQLDTLGFQSFDKCRGVLNKYKPFGRGEKPTACSAILRRLAGKSGLTVQAIKAL